jgi:hypothetical protein
MCYLFFVLLTHYFQQKLRILIPSVNLTIGCPNSDLDGCDIGIIFLLFEKSHKYEPKLRIIFLN